MQETEGLALPIINHYMLMSFHTQRSASVCVCLHVYSCKRVRVCVCKHMRAALRGHVRALRTTHANPARSPKITSSTFSFHCPINIKQYYIETGFSDLPNPPHTHTLFLVPASFEPWSKQVDEEAGGRTQEAGGRIKRTSQ